MLVAGMRTFSTYHMRAIVDYLNGAETIDADHTFATGGLPSTSLPNLTVTTPSELTPSSGVELLSLFYIGSTPDPAREAVACDLNGNVIWYYDYDQSLGVPEPIKLLANGNMMANILPVGSSGDGAPGLLREIDLAGNTVRELSVADLNTRLANAGYNLVVNAMHHDFAPLPNGHIILLTNHTENVSNVTGYTGTVTVVGDTLIDVDQNFNPVWVWDTFDHLDINRHPMGFPPDWTHGNGLVYLPDDGNLLFSMRHQHWVIKIDYEDGKGTGDILWRFGYQGDFTLASGAPPAFAYGQHDPSILSTTGVGVFKLGVFDNGNNRVLDDSGTICGTSSTPPCYSRVPIFDMDETTKTASVEWEDILNVFSGFVGSMQELPNGNIEFDIGAYSTSPVPRARIMEVTPDSLQQTVWQLDIYNQFAYRGLRMPSLYPGVQW